jgi:salicylate hydroxylase
MPSSQHDKRILISGAGIGGLSTAIALAHQGSASLVLERSAFFSIEGAGIQLGPNATKILRAWGVLDRLLPKAVVCEEVLIGDGFTGKHLTSVPFGKAAEQRYGAPFLLVHRADLHQALLDTANDMPGIEIDMDCDVRSYEQFPDKVVLTTMKNTLNGRALIAADGIWSTLRRQIDRGATLSFAGKTAWRTLMEPEDLPGQLQGPRTGVWLSNNVHLVHYPVRGGKKINVVAVVNERWGGRTEGWNQEADPQLLMPAFEKWDERIAQFVNSGTSWRKWSLYRMPPLRAWTQGSATLIGDAAHPMLPFLAQGGAMAIEDASVLTRILAEHDDDPWRAFRHYETARIERTARTAYESRKMGNIYHMGGVLRLARNFIMRQRSPQSLLKKFDWLYQYPVGG